MNVEAMNTQPEALRLANELDAVPEKGADPDVIQEAAAELRRLHAENTDLRAAIQQAKEQRWKLSCGCPSQYGGIPAEWATTDRDGSPAIAYGVICEKNWHEYDAQHPQRAWQGLTDDEIEDEWERITGHSIFGGDKAEGRAMYLAPDEVTEFTRAVETKLKEKNT
jgi:hypothetical protein